MAERKKKSVEKALDAADANQVVTEGEEALAEAEEQTSDAATDVAIRWQKAVKSGYASEAETLDHELLTAASRSRVVNKMGEMIRNEDPARIALFVRFLMALGE